MMRKDFLKDPKYKYILLTIIAAVLVLILLISLLLGGRSPSNDPTGGSSSPDPIASSTQGNSQPSTGIPASSSPASSAPQTDPVETTVPPTEILPDTEDPEHSSGSNDAEVEIPDAGSASVTAVGIDVSRHQGIIDWAQVAADGIDFAMIRVGYRAKVSGEIIADATAEYNIQQALKFGIDVGVYFFSSAITEDEAAEEAKWVADFIAGYDISYPVAYNCEGFNDPENRQYGLTKTQRSDIALRFLNEIESRGYDPMFYASKSELQGSSQWDTARIEAAYQIWVAHYPDAPYPTTQKTDYTGKFSMWQYSEKGKVAGISGAVDLNAAYFTVDNSGTDPGTPDQGEAAINWDQLLNFRPVEEQVTAKEKTNLRDIPSQGEDSTVLYTLLNGEIATRIAISDYGWSKLMYNGQIFYAVSSYLTTDLTPPAYEIQTQFEEVYDLVTAKDVVNLRTLPSVTNENSEVVAQLTYGEVIVRTGINRELGWSRVEYNGQTLYCVSQYLLSADELPENTSEPTE